jgi:hypothetical protein
MAATQAGVAAWAGGVGIDVDLLRTRGGEVCVQARVRRQAQLAAGMLQGRFAPDRLCVALAASPHFHLPSAPSGGARWLASTFSLCVHADDPHSAEHGEGARHGPVSPVSSVTSHAQGQLSLFTCASPPAAVSMRAARVCPHGG